MRQSLVVPRRLDEADDGLLGLGEVGGGLADDRRLHGAELALGQRRRRPFLLPRARARLARREPLLEAGLDLQQRARHVHERLRVGLAIRLAQRLQALDLLLHQLARGAEAEHRQRVRDTPQHLGHVRERLLAGLARAADQVERVLDLAEVLADGGRDGLEELAVVARQRLARGLQLLLVRQQLAEAEGLLDGAHQRAARARARHVVEQVLEELHRRLGLEGVLAVLDDAPHLPVELAEQQLERDVGLEAAVAQRLDHAARRPPQACGVSGTAGGLQPLQGALHQLQALGAVLVAVPGEQPALEHVPQAARAGGELGRRQGRRRRRLHRDLDAEVGVEERVLREQVLAARGAQVVEDGQQHHRQIAPARLQPLEIVRQLQQRAHQHLVGVLALRHAVLEQRLHQPLHLLGQHRGTVELQHLERPAHLVQVARAELELGRVAGILDVGLQGLARLLEGLLQLGAHPSERARVDAFAEAHAAPPPARATRRKARVSG